MMEEKDELVVLNNPEESGSVAMPESAPAEHHEEPGAAPDYSHLSKSELVDILKEMAGQNDPKRPDAILKEIKNHYDEILEGEKAEALKRFIDNGGVVDDFDYRLGPLDVSFEAQYKLLKDKKAEYLRSIDDQKNENLKRKNELLEELRKLVDGEDNKHSFEQFKDIQNKWKLSGPVPANQVRPLWASYHALVDRFYDNRNIYFELKELDRRKNLEAKLELCQRAEKLASVEKIGEAVRELNELHEEFKHIGPVARELKDGLWERFKTASDAVYVRRDESVATLHQELLKNLAAKEEIINELNTFQDFASDRIKEWNEKTVQILALQKRWETGGSVPHSRSKEINRKFWAGFKNFFNSKGAFFKKLDESRVANLALKKELVKQAEALKESKDWDRTANELKKLQMRWKEIGPVPEKQRERIFQEFKAACDAFFDQRRHKIEEADKVQSENLQKKESICQSLEQMTTEKTGTIGQLKELQRSFHSIGFVPHNAVNRIKTRFTTAVDNFMASLEVSQTEKDQAVLDMQLEQMKSDPDAAHKIHQREQILKKKIAKAENDLATLKNNLEFFGRSRNADLMRAEFGEKIKASSEELDQLKAQLKALKTAR